MARSVESVSADGNAATSFTIDVAENAFEAMLRRRSVRYRHSVSEEDESGATVFFSTVAPTKKHILRATMEEEAASVVVERDDGGGGTDTVSSDESSARLHRNADFARGQESDGPSDSTPSLLSRGSSSKERADSSSRYSASSGAPSVGSSSRIAVEESRTAPSLQLPTRRSSKLVGGEHQHISLSSVLDVCKTIVPAKFQWAGFSPSAASGSTRADELECDGGGGTLEAADSASSGAHHARPRPPVEPSLFIALPPTVQIESDWRTERRPRFQTNLRVWAPPLLPPPSTTHSKSCRPTTKAEVQASRWESSEQ
ncbi:hypothetical protein DFJ73DRAFT_819844 [Zopfochytrium polystomum]|nr:hypothetical protein DFJ73DRAFT_819844 [Zopfochytrium polystomum]